MEQTPNLTKAIISVMKAVKGIEKSMTVGTGSYAYKGVSDQEVKKIIGSAMAENGLCIIPISVDPKTTIERWEENGKSKQSVLTEATTRYLLMHESGEFREVAGYGHGIDTQDKGAGKATTYALKYTLLYLFLVPTGKIDDADNDHSDEKEIPGLNPQWEETLKTCKTKADVLHLYNQNKAAVNSDKRLQELFKTYQNKLK